MNSTMLSSVCGLHTCVHGCLEFHSGTESLGLQLGAGGMGGTGFCRADACLQGCVHSALSTLTVGFTQPCWTPDYFLQDVAHW